MAILRLCSLILALGFGLAEPAQAEPRILWRLENPFRFFTHPADTEMHRATYLALRADDRQAPILSSERELAARHEGQGWAATMSERTCWNTARNRHECPCLLYTSPSPRDRS